MKHIIIDSNVFWGEYFLLSNSFKLLNEYLDKNECKFVVPKIIFDEVVNKYEESLSELVTKNSKCIKNLSKILNIELENNINTEDIQTYVRKYKRFLLLTLKNNYEAVFIEYPKITHKHVVRRALKRRKPFDADGHDGYRDTIIWESIKSYAKDLDDEIVFISKNTRDFANKDGLDFHEDLREELKRSEFYGSDFTYYSDIRKFVDKEIVPTLQKVESVFEKIKNNEYTDVDIKKLIHDNFAELINLEHSHVIDTALPSGFFLTELKKITVCNYKFLGVYKSDYEYFAFGSAILDGLFRSEYDKSIARIRIENPVTKIEPAQYLDDFANIEFQGILDVEFLFSFDIETSDIESIEITNIHPEFRF